MFDINDFNVIQDDNYYYVFRSLEAGDISDINDGITDVMRTDRERCTKKTKYSEDSNISLEEMFDHIKMHYRTDTNCISFTTNAGVAIMYGRDKELFNNEAFNDQYVVLKIPKDELGTISHFAPSYMINEISELVDEFIQSSDVLDKYQFDRISNCTTQEQLDNITKSLEGEEIFECGIEFNNTKSSDYTTLSSKQNLEKNKLIAKIGLIPYDIIPNVSNRFLIQTIGSAFASMEVTHYKSIDKEYLIDCPNNIIDIFSILQQSNNPRVKEIEKILIEKLFNGELNNLEEFKYNDYGLTDEDLSIDNLYTISDNGKVDYNTMRNLYIKTFYLAKSKLRTIHSINLLRQILGNEYDDVLRTLLVTHGIEPEITNKQSKDKIVLSDSIGLDYSTDIEKNLYNLINNKYYSVYNLTNILDSKEDCISIAMIDLLEDYTSTNKEDYYANAVIDAFDWKEFNISNIASRHRNNLIKKLKESNFMSVYEELKKDNYSTKDISRILLANIINGNDTIDRESTFTIEQLEDYLGYFKVKDVDIKLTRYQADAIRNMKKSYKHHNYTNVILPTGTGKSYVAITEMLEYLNSGKKVLYLAPDTYILNQIRYYLVKEIIGDSFTESDIDKVVQKKYPNLILQTYSYLTIGSNSQKFIKDKYDFIITDELHRTGAKEWKDKIEELYSNQDDNCKILGITATPTRDCDGVDMAEYWARFFGYTDEEIYSNHHLAYNMDYNQAIAFGYLANPRVVNCEYEFLKEFESEILTIEDEEEREKLLAKVRKDLLKVKGVAEILRENVQLGDTCLVFCPVSGVDEETGQNLTAEQKIEKYKKKLEEIYGKENINCYSMLGSYTDKKNQEQLENFQNVQSDKINFMIVLDMMNEGKHGNYNKLIWFRSLDDNSFVLCSQQLGRISKLLKPGKQLSEEERPLAIDIPNNLLRIQSTKAMKKSVDSDDISKFRLVINWIEEYNRIPDINSKDSVESSMAIALKFIIFKYHNKVKDIESITNYKKKIQTIEIKRLSEKIDINIWDLRLPKRTRETKERMKPQIPYYTKVNPLYRDYINLLISSNMSVDDKINEIYEIYEMTREMPNTKCTENFSNGTNIGNWLKRKDIHEAIKSLARNGNKKAQKIVDKLGWNQIKIELELVDKINEIYEIYKKTGIMPNTRCTENFSNGTKIKSWLSIKDNQEAIKSLARNGNKKAQKIVDKLGWNFTNEERINEIYEIYKKTGIMPNTKCTENFSNDTNIGYWLQSKDNQEAIKSLARNGNEKAQKIVDKLGWNQIKIELELVDRINEIYEIYKRTGKMPNTQCTENFSNGTNIGNWLQRKDIQEAIKSLARDGNKKAQKIVNKLGWNQIKIELVDRINEIYEIYEKTGKMPNRNCTENFSNGTNIGYWLQRKDIQEAIKSLARNGNEKAQKILDELGWNQIKIELGLVDRINEIYEIYKRTGKMPNRNCTENFSNGTNIGNWLAKKDIQEAIKSLARNGNKKAQKIVDKLGWNQIKIEFVDRINEIYEIYEKTGIMPNTKCTENFSNGKNIGHWLTRKDNQEAIKSLARDGNEKAQKILDELGWNFTNEERINEIYETYIKTGIMPNTLCTENFSNGTNIGYWLGKKDNQEAIKSLARNGNEKAQKILDELGWNQIKIELGLVDRINEIYEIYEKTGIMPNTVCTENFSNDTIIGCWLQSKDNQEAIKSLARNGNKKAQKIVDKLGWNFTNEERINEIYEIYKKTGKMPNTKCTENFSNGTNIGHWLTRKDNQEAIKSLARNGNEKAQKILDELGWNQIKIKLELVDKINEIYEIYKKTGIMPNTGCTENFSNGTNIGNWLSKKDNQEAIKSLASTGNEKAQKILDELKCFKNNINLANVNVSTIESKSLSLESIPVAASLVDEDISNKKK